MFLIFDTETTGLPRDYNAPITDSDNWPRLVQIAWQLHDETGKLLHFYSAIIKPVGYTIPFNSAQIHGITTERAIKEGKNLKEILLEFIEIVKQSKYLCGHNIEFDINIIGAEFYRAGFANAFDELKQIDTKNDQTTLYCAIPGGKGGKFKWPTLTELYTKLFNEKFAEAHNAAFDVQATAKTFFEIIKLGITKVAEINNPQTINYQSPDLSELLSNELKLKQKKTKSPELRTPNSEPSTINYQPSTINFSHLHNHTQYSVLQSTSDVTDLVKRAADYGLHALAITDHGNMYGAFAFWQAVEKQNNSIKYYNDAIDKGDKTGEKKNHLKCIIGCELFVTKNHLDKSKQDNGYSIPFLAKNKIGYENISKLSSIGFTEGFYYVPRIDKDVLLQYKEGLIVTTGGLAGEVPSLILNVGEQQAEEAFLWYKENFGEDFYVELNRHNLPDEDHVNEVILQFAKKHNVKYFAANNNYYIDKKGSEAHDVLLCVKDGELKETPIGRGRGFRYGMPNNEFYFKTPKEISELFSDLPEALETTNEISEKIKAYKLGREVLLPKFIIPNEFKDARDEDPKDEGKGNRGENAYLKYLTFEGAKKRYPDLTSEIKERLDFELNVMERMGYPGYFLIVSDFTTKAREMGVAVGPGRGSAAGSAVAYCLGITNVDPIKYDLLFERFLNPDRISMPDIDIDFDDEGRDKVIDYVIDKYGKNQVAQIITYGTMGGKSAIRDAARVLNLPLPEADKLAKSFPDSLEAELKTILKPGGIDEKYLEKIKDRREIIDASHAFRKLSIGDSPEAKVLQQAYELEGSVRNVGTHACGVIIAPFELTKFVPVTKAKDSSMLVTQFDNSVAEYAGLLKMDFLGLKTLTIIKDALALIKKGQKIEIDIDAIPLDDKKTLELFQRGETNGIFQFESTGMQKYLKDLKPDCINDLIAMNALYRPGPLAYIPNYVNRKHGREKITYDLEGMEEFLKETYGITVYQEQVMRLSQKLANFTKGDADTLRKAMGKKQKDVLDKMKSKYLEGCKTNGHDTTVAEKVWKDWEAFASYAFNKSHSTCYAYLAFQTAYLKANYPSEFMASVLNHSGAIEKITFFMEECKRMGIKVLGPDVNEGFGKFSVNPNGNIRFGMASIKGVGENVISVLVEEREKNGKFTGPFDLAKRLDSKTINKKSVEGLVLAGAMDSFTNLHRAMFFVADADGNTLTDKLIKYANLINNGNDTSQASLFGEGDGAEIVEPQLPNVAVWDTLYQLGREKEVVGFYISGHPLDPYKLEIEHLCKANCALLKAGLEPYKGKEVTIAGIIVNFENRTSKTGNAFGKIVIEDYHGAFDIMLFGRDFIEYSKYMQPHLFVFVKGKVQDRYNQPGSLEFKVQKIELLNEIKEKAFTNLKLKINVNKLNDELITNLEKLFKQNSGKAALEIFVEDPDDNMSVKLYSKAFKVSINNELMNELDRMIDVKTELF